MRKLLKRPHKRKQSYFSDDAARCDFHAQEKAFRSD
jgi:hypothetical protein